MLENKQIFICDRTTINISLNIYYCGTEAKIDEKNREKRYLDHYLLYYVKNGEGYVYVNEVKRKVKPHDVFLITPGDSYCYYPKSNQKLEVMYVAFYGHQADGYMSRAGFSSIRFSYEVLEHEYFYNQLKKLIEFADLKINRYCKMLSCIYGMIAYLVEQSLDLKIKWLESNNAELYLRQSLEYIDRNYRVKMSIQDMADFIGLDRKYIYKLFMDKLNKSPQKYLIEKRISRAEQLLRNTSFSVAEVGKSVGYPEVFYFSKIFKQVVGVSPSQYRKEYQEKNISAVDMHMEEMKVALEEKDKRIKFLETRLEKMMNKK